MNWGKNRCDQHVIYINISPRKTINYKIWTYMSDNYFSIKFETGINTCITCSKLFVTSWGKSKNMATGVRQDALDA